MISETILQEYDGETGNAQFDIMNPLMESELLIRITANNESFKNIFTRPKWRLLTKGVERYDKGHLAWSFFKKWGTVIPQTMFGITLCAIGTLTGKENLVDTGSKILDGAL